MAKYIDFDVDFSKNQYTSDINVKKELHAIRQSIINIIMTNPGEKPFLDYFGLGLRRILFEPQPFSNIQQLLNQQIIMFEPRINNIQIIQDNSRIDSNILYLNISYDILSSIDDSPISDSIKIGIKKVR